MLFISRAFYHIRKPRVLSEADISFINYKKSLRQARKEVHLESVRYQNQIEDQYLEQHQQAIRKQHFENQCTFRKQIFTDAFRLYQNQLRWKKEDERFSAALNKHLHDEDVRKINRSRILKIMEHQSTHYWFNHDNVDTRLQEETIFPEYVASSEYYFKLFAEALAYQLGNFQEVHLYSSNEEIIREKNKYLIPLYLTLRSKITAYRKNQIQEIEQKHRFELGLIRNNQTLTVKEIEEMEKKLTETYQEKLKAAQQRKAQQKDVSFLKSKIKDLISIFKTWKEYTNILALTSAQVIKNQMDVKTELQIEQTEKEVLKSVKVKKSQTFVDSIEEDTEQMQMTFEEYLTKINSQRKESQVSPDQNKFIQDFDVLMSSVDSEPQTTKDSISPGKAQQPDLSSVTKSQSGLDFDVQVQELNPFFFNPRQTTSSVQILKERFKDDQEMLDILNQLGEIDLKYPKLFEQIWRSSHH